MKDIRQGNDLKVAWSIFMQDGEPFRLDGKDVSLYLKNMFGRKELNDFVVTGNIIQWTFYGKDQKNTGKYSLELVINEGEKGMITTDKCDFVNLVSCSCKLQGGEDAPNVETESIELTSTLEYVSGGGDYDDTALWKELENKVDKVEGLGLSEENYTANEKAKLAGLEDELAKKVDKEEGKGLSSNDFTNEDKIKVQMLQNGELEKRVDLGEFSLFARWMMTGDEDEPIKLVSSGIENRHGTLIARIGGDGIVIPQEIGNELNLTTLTEYLGDRFADLEVFIEDLQNTKIDKEADDYYPQLSVGLADNLAGEDEVDSEISFRRSGGGAISDGTARIEAIKGNSVVWNQLAVVQGVKGSYDNSEGEGISYQNSGLTVNYTTAINGHKIYASVIDRKNEISYFYFTDNVQLNLLGGVFFTANTTIPDITNIIARVPAGVNASWDINCIFVDLTKMFGAGNEPTTIEEFNARKPLGIDENAYNEGEVIHMDVQSLESVGVNQWDEQWESGTIAGQDGNLVDDATKIRTSNFIRVLPNKEYHFTQPSQLPIRVFLYGADKAYKAYDYITSSTFLIPSDVYYIKAVFEYATYNHDICINLSDASINGKYFPYIKRTQSLAIIGEGLRSAGSARDEIRYNKATQKWEKVQRIAEVDMGSLALAYDSNNGGYFYAQLNGAKVPSSWAVVGNVLSERYYAKDADSIVATGATPFNMSMGIAPNGNVYFVNTAYTNVASFKAAMQGVILYYELAEPIVTEIEGDFNLDYEVWNGGTEEVISDVQTTPLKADIAYGFNAVGKIKELEEKLNNGGGGGGVSKEYVDGKLTELSAEVSGKQDTITDLETIRSGAEKGATAIQEVKTINGQSIVGKGNIDIQGGGGSGGGITTPSGDPMHYMFEAAGATYNATDADTPMVGVYGDSYVHKAKHWHLNELGDITNEEMRRIYLYANLDNGAKGTTKYLAGIETRTNIATWSSSWNGKIKDQEVFAYAFKVIVARLRDREHYIDTNASFAFTRCGVLQKVLPTLDATSTTSFNGAFENCNNLREVRIKNVKVAIIFDKSPLISKASILYLIQNSAATSAITITLHADAYARFAEDTDIVAALAEKEFVSLASA